MDTLSKKIPVFHDILKILGYSVEGQYKRVNDFMFICQMSTVEKMLQICKDKGMNLDVSGLKDQGELDNVVEQIIEVVGEEEFEKVADETVVALFDDFVATVYSECDESQRERIERLVS